MCVVMLRHNVLHHCCVNQSSKDDYFIMVCGAREGVLCSIFSEKCKGITILVENISDISESYKNVSGITILVENVSDIKQPHLL